jgi:hypothetical protein
VVPPNFYAASAMPLRHKRFCDWGRILLGFLVINVQATLEVEAFCDLIGQLKLFSTDLGI